MIEGIQALEPVMRVVDLLALTFLGYFLFYKSALVFLWFRPLSPLLHRLGFRVVTMDMSFGIFAIRWRREWAYLWASGE